ncbi:uncharacterized protein LOC34622484 [Cyclospora cayetanensis]|uniref:Phosphatidate cytidylyltransferase n=1 Tax=Cyclospora cayetanensis TaxID=88456 RepID=A0A6P6RVF8_9EIME|nr:uncharacterized protein LOC34622484 [Cyclospora cayetanensis]
MSNDVLCKSCLFQGHIPQPSSIFPTGHSLAAATAPAGRPSSVSLFQACGELHDRGCLKEHHADTRKPGGARTGTALNAVGRSRVLASAAARAAAEGGAVPACALEKAAVSDNYDGVRAAASGWDDGTEAVGDSDEPECNSSSTAFAIRNTLWQRPRARSSFSAPAAASQQDLQQRGLSRRSCGYSGSGTPASCSGNGSGAQHWPFILHGARAFSHCCHLQRNNSSTLETAPPKALAPIEPQALPWYWLLLTIVAIGLPWGLPRLRGVDPQLSCTPSPVFISRCTDTEIHRLGLSWWEDDPAVLKQQQVLQRQQLALLKEHQALTVKAAAADEQLLLLAQLQPPEQHQQQHHQHQEAAIQAMRSSLVARLLALEAAREETAAAERGLCRSLFASPFDFHSMVLGSFAAFFAPFGGFFASGFKRAVRIKDFGYFIPGHGGVTDRFDCQVVMGLFTFLYQKTFIPQIGEAEAAARRTVQQQQQLLLLQMQQEQQRRRAATQSNSSTGRTAAALAQDDDAASRGEHLAAHEEDADPSVAALLTAVHHLTPQQLVRLQQGIEAIAAAANLTAGIRG